MKRKAILQSALALSVLGTLVLTGGCQTPGKVVSTEPSNVCPQCETQTVTTPIKGLTYTKHMCPMCKTVSTVTPNYDELGDDIKEIQVCEHCQANLITCPQCNKR